MQIVRHSQGERGDTIVEVLIALAILSLSFGIAYATANRSSAVTQNAEEHTEALQYVTSQIELLRNDAVDPAMYTTTPFCMDPNPTSPTYGKPIAVAPTTCLYNTAVTYKVSIAYTPNIVSGVAQDNFKVSISWPGIAGLGTQRESLSYKVHQP